MACGNNCSCNQDNEDNNRRNFLKSSVTTLAATLVGGSLINSLVSCKEKPKAEGEKVNVLTHDGKLVSVDKSQVANFKPVITDEDVRRGIPGKKFVMVIDLA